MKKFLFGIFGKISSFIGHKVVYHTLGWLLFALLNAWILSHLPQEQMLGLVTINLLFYGIAVYFNYFFLLPTYLGKKRPLMYLVLCVLAAMVVTPAKMFFDYVWLVGDLDQQIILLRSQTGQYIATFAVIIASTFAKTVSDWMRQQRYKQELENKNLQSELNFLRAQIDPHFLFNTLNSLYALTLKQSPQAPDLVLKLSEIMRYMLYECNERFVFLENELNYIRNYVELEKIRLGGKTEVGLQIEGNTDGVMIAPLLFVCFIENAFKHGVGKKIGKGKVNIIIHIDEQEIDFRIVNSKPEIAQSFKQGGIGMSNVKRRLELIYTGKYSLNIDQNEELYIVELKIPKITSDENKHINS